MCRSHRPRRRRQSVTRHDRELFGSTPITRFGAGNAGPNALIVFHSAHRGFRRSLQPVLAEALAANGWRVDLTTASREGPTISRLTTSSCAERPPTIGFRPNRSRTRVLHDAGSRLMPGQRSLACAVNREASVHIQTASRYQADVRPSQPAMRVPVAGARPPQAD